MKRASGSCMGLQAVVLALGVALAAGGAMGETWSGGAGAGNEEWNHDLNWDGGAAPANPTTNTVTFGNTGATNVIGAVNNVVEANRTVGRLQYQNTGTSYHTTKIPAGVTLTANDTSGDYVFAGNMAVNADSRMNIQGGGTLDLNHPGRRIQITTGGVWQYRRVTLDMSKLDTFKATVQDLHLAYDGGRQATVYLATNNTITASGELGVGGFIGDAQAQADLFLGTSNVLNVGTLHVGRGRGTVATMSMQGDGSGASVRIRGAAGGSSRVTTVNIGNCGWNSTANTGTMDFEQADVDAMFGTVIMGRGIATTSQRGYGYLHINRGVIDATMIRLGENTASGLLNIGANAEVIVDTIRMDHDGTVNTGRVNMVGGTLTVKTVQKGTATSGAREINWAGGTIQNYPATNTTISDLTSFNVAGSPAACAFDVESGRKITVNSAMTGTGGFTKKGAGELILATNVSHDVGIVVSNGTLTLNATLAHTDVRIASDGTLAGAGTLTFNINAATADPGVFVNGGTLDMSALSLTFAGTVPTLDSYSVVTNAAGTLTGAFAATNSLPGGFELVQDAEGIRLERLPLVYPVITVIDEDTYPTGNTLTIAWTTDLAVSGWLAYRVKDSGNDYALTTLTSEGITHTRTITGLTELTDYDVVIWSSGSSKAYPMTTLIADPAPGDTTWTGTLGAADRRWARGLNWDVGQPPGTAAVATFGNTGATNVIGAVNNIVEANRTVARLRYQNTGTSYHTTEIPTGTTLTVDGGGSYVLAGSTVNATTWANMTGGGALVVSNAAATVEITCANTFYKYATLDLSALNAFTANVNNLHLGVGARGKYGTLYLATNSTITAAGTLGVGGFIGDAQAQAQLYLGTSNTLHIGTLFVARGTSSSASVSMQGDGAGATVTLRGPTGGDSRANVEIAYNGWNTTPTGTIDFEQADVDARIDTLTFGELVTSTRAGNASMTVNRGTVDVVSLRMVNGSGTLTVGPQATVLAPSVKMADGSRLSGNNWEITLNGGTLRVGSELTTYARGTCTVTVNVGAAPCGLDLAEAATLTLATGGKIQLNFTEKPTDRGMEGHYGLRWPGDRRVALQDLKDELKLAWNDSGAPGLIEIYRAGGVTYVGILPPRGTMILLR